MKVFSGLVAFFATLAVAFASAASPLPTISGPVNDYAHLLSSTEAASLTARLDGIGAQTSSRVVVLTVPSLGGRTVEDFSDQVYHDARVGGPSENGVLIVVAPLQHKLNVRVGTGLAPYLTTDSAAVIVNTTMAPLMRNHDYYDALDSGITGIKASVKAASTPVPDHSLGTAATYGAQSAMQQPAGSGPSGPDLMVLLVVGVGVIVVMNMARKRHLKKSSGYLYPGASPILADDDIYSDGDVYPDSPRRSQGYDALASGMVMGSILAQTQQQTYDPPAPSYEAPAPSLDSSSDSFSVSSDI